MIYLISQQHILLFDICVIVVKYLFDCDGIFVLTPTFSCGCRQGRGKTGERTKCNSRATKEKNINCILFCEYLISCNMRYAKKSIFLLGDNIIKR